MTVSAIVVGCRLSEVTTQSYTLPRPGQAAIQVDIDPDVVGAVVPVDLGVVAWSVSDEDDLDEVLRESRPHNAHGKALRARESCHRVIAVRIKEAVPLARAFPERSGSSHGHV